MRTLVFKLTGLAILSSLAACDGDATAGAEALVNISEEPAGENCENGGTRIDSGIDENGDHELALSEVQSTAYSCNGKDGADGAPGDGKPGADGENGHGALVSVSPEGALDECPQGGRRVEQGVDVDDDGKLDASEVVSSFQVCGGTAGADGADGSNMLLSVTAEAAGANCAHGGQKIESGADDDGDGVFDESEVESVAYVCSGGDGSVGLDSLVSTAPEAAGDNCTNGGIRVDVGTDEDGSATLEVGEIDATHYLCAGEAGADGLDSLVSVVDEAAGANCPAGGERITYGFDADRDGILDAGEVAGTRYACDGAEGAAGLSALVSVTAEDPGTNCATGGVRIDSGIDDDANGTLAGAEVDATSYVCNGNE